jgi:parvulin-like peptidyl-prolyl isomerase
MRFPPFSTPGRRRRPAFWLGALAAVLSTACRSTPATNQPAVSADTWAVVDGRPITREEIEKAYRRSSDPNQTISSEEALAAKLNLLNDLIAQDLLLAKAGTLKLEVPAAELETAYVNARQNLTDEAFQKELSRRNLTAADMRESLRRQLLAEKVIQQEVSSKVSIADADVQAFFAANQAQFNLPEEAYHIAQIVVTPEREAQVANATGDDATSPQAAAAKVRMIMERIKAGTSFRELAAGYSEDPASAARGGDMGLVSLSRLQQAPPRLRDAVLNKEPGTVNVASAGNGAYTIVLVVAREAAGQRDLSTPGVRDQISNTLRSRKTEVLRLAYLTMLRADATVVNHLARRLVEGRGTLPASLPTTNDERPSTKPG